MININTMYNYKKIDINIKNVIFNNVKIRQYRCKKSIKKNDEK